MMAFQSCKHQHQVKFYEAKDRVSELPDDIVLIIMSFLTMKEAAMTSVLSHRWNYLWRCFPVLVFENLSAMRRILYKGSETLERLNFLRWVNRVVEAHCGEYVDELRVVFDLDNSCQSDMDKWLVFAIAKQVKRLELNFLQYLGTENDLLPKWHISLQNLSFFKSCLRSLSLKSINVSTKDIDCLLRSCVVLENLCICSSPTLKYIRASVSPPQLKYLEVSDCRRLKLIDILAPKLLSFKHIGKPVELHVRCASMLSKLSLGRLDCSREIVTHVLDFVSMYFPQLEYLSLGMRMFHWGTDLDGCIQYNLGISNPPAMKNLKHLELIVFTLCDQSLLGWADFIEASPRLERLTLKFTGSSGNSNRMIMKRNGRPLKSLATLELCNNVGLPIDLEFVTYVVEHSIMLKNVIVELYPLSKHVSVQDDVAKLRQIVPQGVNITLNIIDVQEAFEGRKKITRLYL